MKKADLDRTLERVALRAYADFKALKITTYDELLNVVDEYLEQSGLTAFEYGDDVVDLVRDNHHIAVCDRCGALMKDEDRVEVGRASALRKAVMVMSRAGETDYLRDDIIGVEAVCKHCEHEILEYVPKFTFAGCVYASQAELEADAKRVEKFRAEGSAKLEELPRPLIETLKEIELDKRYFDFDGQGASYMELVCADYLVSDEELEESVGGVEFVPEDFVGNACFAVSVEKV